MKEKFDDHKFSKASMAMITKCSEILDDYESQGYKLTLRQLYYQIVSRDLFPADRTFTWNGSKWVRDPKGTKNATPNYKWLGEKVSDARMSGLLDWEMIEDRGRENIVNSHWKTPASILRSAAHSFRLNRWVDQNNYVEVFVEKDALSGILLPVCTRLDVGFTANKGYSSLSAVYQAAKRIAEQAENGKDIHIIYFGDHDPSGMDMTRDIRDRIEKFTYCSFDFEVHRLALNYEQIQKWQPPENPAKESDSRFKAYAAEFGESSWELDAVDPATLEDLVQQKIEDLIDWDIWEKVEKQELAYIEELEALAKKY